MHLRSCRQWSLAQNNDIIRVDLNKFTVDVLIDDAELKTEKETDDSFLKPEKPNSMAGYIQEKVNPFSQGMTLKGADKHKNIAAPFAAGQPLKGIANETLTLWRIRKRTPRCSG